MLKGFKMIDKILIEEEYVIDDLEILKVVSDPLRVRIIELVGLANRAGQLPTVKHLADQLDIPATKLYYHVKLLEKHGIIRVAQTQVVSGIIEKHYQVRAYRISIEKQLIAGDQSQDEGLAVLLSSTRSLFEIASKNLEDSFSTMARHGVDVDGVSERVGLLLQQSLLRLTPEQSVTFEERLEELLGDFSAEEARPDVENSLVFGFTLVFHPNFHLSDPDFIEAFKEV
jgi:DNA-binding transcriptional ArsR family regulator